MLVRRWDDLKSVEGGGSVMDALCSRIQMANDHSELQQQKSCVNAPISRMKSRSGDGDGDGLVANSGR